MLAFNICKMRKQMEEIYIIKEMDVHNKKGCASVYRTYPCRSESRQVTYFLSTRRICILKYSFACGAASTSPWWQNSYWRPWPMTRLRGSWPFAEREVGSKFLTEDEISSRNFLRVLVSNGICNVHWTRWSESSAIPGTFTEVDDRFQIVIWISYSL
jgi:hypothetical protein